MGDGLKRAYGAAVQSNLPVRVEVGQVWADNDPRSQGRTLIVKEIDGMHAVCVPLKGRDPEVNNGFVSTPAKRVRIRLDRFKPTSTGYKLVSLK